MSNDDSIPSAPTGQCADLLLQNQLCYSLYSTSLMMTKVYKPLLQDLNLTYPQYLAMLVLWETDGLTVSDISARMLTDPGSMTPLLKRLEAEGLIHRTRGKEDERVVRLYLSEQGKALYDRAKRIPACVHAASGLNQEQLRDMQKSLLKLRAQLHDGL